MEETMGSNPKKKSLSTDSLHNAHQGAKQWGAANEVASPTIHPL